MAQEITYFTLEGLDRLERFLKTLPAKVQQDSLRKAATYATTPLLAAARKEVPVDKGGLKQRLEKRVKVYRRTGTVLAMIGANRDKKTYYHGRKKKGTDVNTSDHPTNILELIHFGYFTRAREDFVGPRKFVPPNRFLSRAFKRAEPLMRQRFKEKLKRDLPKDIARLKKKGVISV